MSNFPRAHTRADVEASLKNDCLVWSDLILKCDVEKKITPKTDLSPTNAKKDLEVELTPKNGKRHLSVTAYDAGAVLKTFDFYKDIVGGKLMLEADFVDMSVDAKIDGSAKIHNFRLVNAPVMARLLGLASIRGIPDELTGPGLAFQELDIPFTLENGIIHLKNAKVKNAKASGLSLGITGSGVLDWEA